MEKCEFSETQFVIAYCNQLFGSIKLPYLMYSPSTREEKQTASDLILKHFTKGRRYRYSEFYQFKRSKYYDKEIFDSLGGGLTIDTGRSPKYGFNIYNSRKTRQFNVMQQISKKPKCHVFYCAPVFHTIAEFNRYFSSGSILANSKVFPISQKELSSVRIPLDSNHQILFDHRNQYLCSDPIEIQGYIASERSELFSDFDSKIEFNFENTIVDVYNIVVPEIMERGGLERFEPPPINFFEVREMLMSYFDIYWAVNFN